MNCSALLAPCPSDKWTRNKEASRPSPWCCMGPPTAAKTVKVCPAKWRFMASGRRQWHTRHCRFFSLSLFMQSPWNFGPRMAAELDAANDSPEQCGSGSGLRTQIAVGVRHFGSNGYSWTVDTWSCGFKRLVPGQSAFFEVCCVGHRCTKVSLRTVPCLALLGMDSRNMFTL